MAAYVQHCQFSVLTGLKHKDIENIQQSLDFYLQGKYEKLLETNAVAEALFAHIPEQCNGQFSTIVMKNLDLLMSRPSDDEEGRDLDILIVAASCLQLYVQNNWLGPPTSKTPFSFCHRDIQAREEEILSEAQAELSIDGEPVYPKSRHLLFLYMARVLFLEGRSFFSHLQTWDIWLMRSFRIQQALLAEKSASLKASVMDILDDVIKREPLMTDDANRDIQMMFHVEAGYALLTYLEYRRAPEHFNTARKIAGISVNLTGAMGKRTRFQEDAKAQLVLQVQRVESHDVVTCQYDHPTDVPKCLPLNDDTVLEDIKFMDMAIMDTIEMSPFEHTVLVGLMETHRRSMAQEKLTNEEIITYLSYIIHHSKVWTMSVLSLHVRSKLQQDSSRRVERSMNQIEDLVKCATIPSHSAAGIDVRIPLFYASNLTPIWNLQRDLAALLLSLGCTGEALNVFETLELWEDVISCYQRLNKLEKAESLIHERLAIKETPTLWCCLGDVTRNIEFYQKAWELSRHRSSRAQRCMGFIYFHEQKYEEAMKCFCTSLEINSLQIPLWFTYGCAAMQCQNFEVGVMAYKRCVVIDYDNFEAWSNLATCYVRLKNKVKAFAVLQDALKCNYDNWRLWENALVIGTDVGEFAHVIRSYNRLMDLKNKWIDVQVLKILTRAVIEKIPDANGEPGDKLVDKVMELFGRITSKVTSEGEIWSCYARLSSTKIRDREPDMDKAMQHLQKAYRCFTQKVDWEKEVDNCKKVADQAIHLAQVHVQLSEDKPAQEALRLLSSAKLMLKGALVKIQKQHTDSVTQELSPDVTDTCNKMDATLTEIVSKIETLKSQ